MNYNFESTITFIRDNFTKNISLEDIAKSANLSQYHFHRLFKQIYGETPNAYLNRLRMEFAGHLLGLYPDKTILEIAIESGYSSLAAFSRDFKKHFELTPSKYRKIPLEEKMLTKHDQFLFDPGYLQQVDVQYLDEFKLYCRLAEPFSDKLKLNFFELKELAEKEKIEIENDNLYGIFIDTPFHTPLEKCRYYTGMKILSKNKNEINNIYTFKSGYFAVIPFSGGLLEFIHLGLHFKFNWLDKSNYEIKSPVGFELINVNSNHPYSRIGKKLFIPLQIKR